MEKKHKKIWKMAEPYLKKGIRKDFVLHTKGVIRAMELLLKKEVGSRDVLIPATILHDTGWSNVPLKLQRSKNQKDKKEAVELHIKYVPPIIQKILQKLGYDQKQISSIIEIVLAHKFQKPRRKDKQLLIDADTLAEVFKIQFYGDAKSYGNLPQEHFNIRKENKFYTKTATRIFEKEINSRKMEIFSGK